jgi:hypothetical protein
LPIVANSTRFSSLGGKVATAGLIDHAKGTLKNRGDGYQKVSVKGPNPVVWRLNSFDLIDNERIMRASNTPQKIQDENNEKNQAKPAAWIVAPIAAMGPRRNGAQCQN